MGVVSGAAKLAARVAARNAAKKAAAREAARAAENAASHASHPSVPHVDPPAHANLVPPTDHAPIPSLPHESPSVATHVAGPIERNLPTLRNIGITAGAGYATYTGVNALNDMRKKMQELPGKALEATEKGVENLGLKMAQLVPSDFTHGPEAAYNAMLAEVHELEAGVKSRASSLTGSGAMSTALTAVTVAGTAYTVLQFYRAYKS